MKNGNCLKEGWKAACMVLIGLLALASPIFAEPTNMEVTWDNPNPTPQTENLTRSKGDADTWDFTLVLNGVRFVGKPTWSYGPEGDAANWGQWNETEPSVSWIAPPGGLKKAGTFFVSVTGDIEPIPVPGQVGGQGAPKIKKMNASWSGNVFGIIIKRDGTDITDQTVNVIVGQKISLTAEITAAPPGKIPSSKQWNVPGSPVKGYSQTLTEGKIIDLLTEDTLQDYIDFYFVTGSFTSSSTDISYRVVIDGIPSTAKTTFKVYRPKVNSFASVTTQNLPPLGIGTPATYGGGLVLHFGGGVDTGITWTGNVTAPNIPGASGELSITQLIKEYSESIVDLTPTAKWVYATGNNYVLDGALGIQYGEVVEVIPQNGTASISTNDSPAIELQTGRKKVSTNMQFQTYLMYKPNGGIWVALSKLTWVINGSATKHPNQFPDTQGWSLDAGAVSTKCPGPDCPASIDTSQPPIWNSDADSIPWQLIR